MSDPYPKHGRRWRWWTPLRWVCRCGLDAYPCTTKQMLDRNARPADVARTADQIYRDGVRYVEAWRDEERHGWDRRWNRR